MENKIKTKTLVLRILSIITLILGFAVLVYGMIDYFIQVSTSGSPLTLTDRPMIIIYISFPIMFLGFFLYVLGYGKKKIS